MLDNAAIGSGDTLLDVGCGDGLIAFGALQRGARVVFSDVSQELLDVCREIAAGDERCSFVQADATGLSAVPDESVDAVTLRSVLIYIAERELAFAEFRRAEAGRPPPLFEPLNSFEYPGPEERWGAWDVSEIQDLADRVKASSPRDPRPARQHDARLRGAGFRRRRGACRVHGDLRRRDLRGLAVAGVRDVGDVREQLGQPARADASARPPTPSSRRRSPSASVAT